MSKKYNNIVSNQKCLKNIFITQYFVALYSREGILNVSGCHLEQMLSLFSPSKMKCYINSEFTLKFDDFII